METLTKRALQIVVIKTKNCVFISDNLDGRSYHGTQINRYLFDDVEPEVTYHKDWFKLKKVPKNAQLIIEPKQKCLGYKLKDGFAPSERMSAMVSSSFFNSIDEDDNNDSLRPFYDIIVEEVPSSLEEVDLSVVVLDSVDNFQPIQSQFELRYNLLDKVTVHPILLQTKECRLTRKASYDIIREHVKLNINPKYARITSDYDFCLTVSKVIQLAEKEEYQKNIARFGAKKPKYVKDYREHRDLEVYKVAPPHGNPRDEDVGAPYSGYPLVEPFTGKNYEDLKKNIAAFLNDLMAKINEPVKECACCKGTGVILE